MGLIVCTYDKAGGLKVGVDWREVQIGSYMLSCIEEDLRVKCLVYLEVLLSGGN